MASATLRVAHVDDDEDLRMLVRVALETTADCAVASCASGAEALEVVPEFRPDVLLVDMLMPGMNGLETVDALRERMALDEVSVVFVTGLDDEEHLAPLRAAGAAIIAKPFDVMLLASDLQRLDSQRRATSPSWSPQAARSR
jgi:CheY-like chemotaxis protein